MIYKYNLNLLEGNLCVLPNWNKRGKETLAVVCNQASSNLFVVGDYTSKQIKLIQTQIKQQPSNQQFVDLNFAINNIKK